MMITTERRGLVLQARDWHLLREIAVLRVIDREQAKKIAGFGSTTRANARLLALHRAGLLKRYFLGTKGAGQKALYGISKQGALLATVPYRGLQRRNDESLGSGFFVQHQLLVNDLYCSLKYESIPIEGVRFERWVHFFQAVVPEIRLIPDGYVELSASGETFACFLEVDRGGETLKVWDQKIRNYVALALSGAFESQFHRGSFRVLVLANSERRLQSIRKTVLPITTKIFWFATIADIEGNRFFDSVWLRPKGDERIPLIDPRS